MARADSTNTSPTVERTGMLMQEQQNDFAPEELLAAPLGEPLAEPQAADEGLRLLRTFLRIGDPALRAAAIDCVSELAKREEQILGSGRSPSSCTPNRTQARV